LYSDQQFINFFNFNKNFKFNLKEHNKDSNHIKFPKMIIYLKFDKLLFIQFKSINYSLLL